MERQNQFQRKSLWMAILLILLVHSTQAQSTRGFLQLNGGFSFPKNSPIDKAWKKSNCYGLRVGLNYKWLQVSIDIANNQFNPRNSHWEDMIREYFLSIYFGPGFCQYKTSGTDIDFSVYWDDGDVYYPTLDAFDKKEHLGMRLTAGLGVSITPFLSFNLEASLHDMFRTSEKYEFFSLQSGVSLFFGSN